jgi:uncharacterized membrane protein
MKSSPRLQAIDALRGLALWWMTAYHFAFDLNHLGWIRQNFLQDPFWTVQRTLIVSLFLLCAGLGQSVAVAQGQTWRRFWRRWAQVAGCAGLVSLGSWWMFPNSFIYFGVLHGLAVMLIVVRLIAGGGAWLWPLGALALAAGWGAEALHQTWPALAWLDAKPFNVLGLIAHKPITEDYVPVLPWLGWMLWGLAAGQWLLRRQPRLMAWQGGGLSRVLAWCGRHSLSWYMLHQPVMLGALMAWRGWQA